MSEEDWLKLLPHGSRATIAYINPRFGTPEPWRTPDFLLIAFPNDVHLEVEWDDDREEYFVTISRDRFNVVVNRKYFPNASSTIAGVKQLARVADFASQVVIAEDVPRSATETTNAIPSQSFTTNRNQYHESCLSTPNSEPSSQELAYA